MIYQIKWLPETLQSFVADLDTFDSAEQRKIMQALDGVDRLLLDSPMSAGESRAVDSDRVLFHPPIFVEYRVETRLSTVWIVQARILRKRNILSTQDSKAPMAKKRPTPTTRKTKK